MQCGGHLRLTEIVHPSQCPAPLVTKRGAGVQFPGLGAAGQNPHRTMYTVDSLYQRETTPARTITVLVLLSFGYRLRVIVIPVIVIPVIEA